MRRVAMFVIPSVSTVTLEAAIFHRPTPVVAFHPYLQERARSYFSTCVLGKRSASATRRCLNEPGWYAAERATLVARVAEGGAPAR